jgi:hypothetical protein
MVAEEMAELVILDLQVLALLVDSALVARAAMMVAQQEVEVEVEVVTEAVEVVKAMLAAVVVDTLIPITVTVSTEHRVQEEPQETPLIQTAEELVPEHTVFIPQRLETQV